MARIPLIEPEQAGERLAPGYQASVDALGFVANIYKVLGHRPEIVNAFVPFVATVVGKTAKLHPNIRDLAVLKASKMNGCSYCVGHRTRMGKAFGLTQEQIDALDGDYAACELYDEKTKAGIAYAEALTRGPRSVSDELFAELERHFSAEEIVDLTTAVALFNLLNRIGEGLKVELEPEFVEAVATA